MPRDVAVVFVHGIYGKQINYAEKMQGRLSDLLPKDVRVAYGSVSWADLVRDRQLNYLRVAKSAGVRDNRFRRYVVFGLGDAAAYQKTSDHENSIYHKVQGRISETLAELDSPGMRDRPLIFVGHSLGCHIISSYAWDLNQFKHRTEADILANVTDEALIKHWRRLQVSPFCRLDTFAGFVTLGNNMPMFTFTFGPERVFPITAAPNADLKPAFPGAALPESLSKQARWLNFFHKHDLLAFPLKPLNPAYEAENRIEDICVHSESLTWRSVPLLSYLGAHASYWTNPTVLRMTAKLISDTVAGA